MTSQISASGSPGRITESLARKLLLCFAIFYVACGVIYNETLLSQFDPTPPLNELVVESIGWSRLAFLALGTFFLLAYMMLRAVPGLNSAASSERVIEVSLALSVVLLPVATIEIAARPLLVKVGKTTLFQRHPELGWSLRPGAEDNWGGVRVKVNSKGLRGPELPYARPAEVRRILYLGDSVTFGFGLPLQDTFPHQAELLLEEATGHDIETVNAGVGGHAPWQEHAFLVSEGIRYEPDIVVLTFVLNDVNLDVNAPRGGASQGYQLRNSILSTRDLLARRSFIFYAVQKIGARLRFGREIQAGARQEEEASVRLLAEAPDDAGVRAAWDVTLRDLAQTVDYCRESGVPLILVASPFTFQFQDPERLSAPQEVLRRFAEAGKVLFLDLLGALCPDPAAPACDPAPLFLDEDHFSSQGARSVAARLATFILERGLLEAQRRREEAVTQRLPQTAAGG